MPTASRTGDGPTGVPGRSAGWTTRTGRRSTTALRWGWRGLAGGSSLAWLLAEERGVTEGANPMSPDERLRAWEAEQFPTHRPRRQPGARPGASIRLTIELILSWADSHHAATARWPRNDSGPVSEQPVLNWSQVNRALSQGSRGLKGGTTLADLLQERRGVPNKQNRPRLDIEQILAWADAYQEATGEYPHVESGPVHTSPGDTWSAINSALSNGLRGLPGGSSLASAPGGAPRVPRPADRRAHSRLGRRRARGHRPLAVIVVVRSGPGRARRDVAGPRCLASGGPPWPAWWYDAGPTARRARGAPNIYTEPPLTAEKILAWADAHFAETGRWPSSNSGPVLHAEGENWGSINTALREGYRGLPGGQSLGRLIRGHGGPDVYRTRPELTVEQVLAWADAHREATGEWPIEDSGPVRSAPGENWKPISQALAKGGRGLPGGSSLARLLAEHRGVRNPKDLPCLTIEQVLAWADAHRAETGRWPSSNSGPVAEGSEETWAVINGALYHGLRGLSGGSSLARLLAKHRPVRPRRLSLRKIRAWARVHREATGRWPDAHAGPVRGVPDETWSAVNAALKFARRGLPGGTTLTWMFCRSLDPAARGYRPELTVEQVLAWADAYHAATGRWPTATSGPVDGAPGEKWVNLNAALRLGRRGLPRGTNLTRLIAEHRGAAADPAAATRSRGGPTAPEVGGMSRRA